jgi:hypothetical protein
VISFGKASLIAARGNIVAAVGITKSSDNEMYENLGK